MAFLTGTNLKTALANLRDTVPASDPKLLEWINYINRESYRGITSVAPSRLISVKTIRAESDDPNIAFPSNFKNIKTSGTGLYKINDSGSFYSALAYDAQTGDFTVALTVTGTSSGATGVIESIYDDDTIGVLTLISVSGTFEDNEALTDSSTGAAVANGTAQAFIDTTKQMTLTGFGDTKLGYWIDGANSNIVMTPVPDQTDFFRLRYIPTLTTLTDIDDDTQIPEEFLQYGRDWLDIFLQQYLVNPNQEGNAKSRFVGVLNTFLEDIRQDPNIYNETDLSVLM